MSSMQEDIQCAGSDTRPPMLDRTDFESWQQHFIAGGTRVHVQQGPVRARVLNDHYHLKKRKLHISSSSWIVNTSIILPGNFNSPSYSHGIFKTAQNLGKAECSNCKFLAEKIKTLEAKIKILEGALEMERHPEKHTLDSVAILHELYNEMGKLSME
ncbi:hypothetical protein Tco_1439227 [Tanacetum coccineum]